ncbi:MAG: lysophospholipid acyltransferase family protein [Bacteroidales bacterium]|nr:lysophospholipid acyltransferase family protein [Bacteroidales bacterium]
MKSASIADPLRVGDEDPTRTRRAWFFRGFRDRYALRYVRKRFHAVRVARGSAPLPNGDAPIIIVLNHPAWWDPLICTVLSRQLEPREQYAAIDRVAVEKYGFFRWLGFFGVDTTSLRGAASFLRTATTLMSQPNRVMWVTAQGRFCDVRERPLALRAGVGHLAARLERGYIVPLALEYSFWSESTLEALARFGEPLDISAHRGNGREWTTRIEEALTQTLDALSADAITRNPALFETVLGGKTGIGGFYDVWRRVKAWGRGRRFDPAHGTESLEVDS